MAYSGFRRFDSFYDGATGGSVPLVSPTTAAHIHHRPEQTWFSLFVNYLPTAGLFSFGTGAAIGSATLSYVAGETLASEIIGLSYLPAVTIGAVFAAGSLATNVLINVESVPDMARSVKKKGLDFRTLSWGGKAIFALQAANALYAVMQMWMVLGSDLEAVYPRSMAFFFNVLNSLVVFATRFIGFRDIFTYLYNWQVGNLNAAKELGLLLKRINSEHLTHMIDAMDAASLLNDTVREAYEFLMAVEACDMIAIHAYLASRKAFASDAEREDWLDSSAFTEWLEGVEAQQWLTESIATSLVIVLRAVSVCTVRGKDVFFDAAQEEDAFFGTQEEITHSQKVAYILPASDRYKSEITTALNRAEHQRWLKAVAKFSIVALGLPIIITIFGRNSLRGFIAAGLVSESGPTNPTEYFIGYLCYLFLWVSNGAFYLVTNAKSVGRMTAFLKSGRSLHYKAMVVAFWLLSATSVARMGQSAGEDTGRLLFPFSLFSKLNKWVMYLLSGIIVGCPVNSYALARIIKPEFTNFLTALAARSASADIDEELAQDAQAQYNGGLITVGKLSSCDIFTDFTSEAREAVREAATIIKETMPTVNKVVGSISFSSGESCSYDNEMSLL